MKPTSLKWDLTLAENEVKIVEYDFHDDKGNKEKCILTNRRLITVSNDSQDYYPLSKITAIGITHTKQMGLAITGIFLTIIAVILFLLISLYYANEALFILPLLLLIIGVLMIFFGVEEDVCLKIRQMGGEKAYTIRVREDPHLIEFINEVTHRLM